MMSEIVKLSSHTTTTAREWDRAEIYEWTHILPKKKQQQPHRQQEMWCTTDDEYEWRRKRQQHERHPEEEDPPVRPRGGPWQNHFYTLSEMNLLYQTWREQVHPEQPTADVQQHRIKDMKSL